MHRARVCGARRYAAGFAVLSFSPSRLHAGSVDRRGAGPVATMAVQGGEGAAREQASAHGHSTRRQLLRSLPAAAAALVGGSQSAGAATAASGADITDGRWWVFPLAPYERKKTVRTEAIAGQVWTFDQIIGALYVHVPLRMTVVKLSEGGLLAFCPISPTPECLALVRELEQEQGPLKYIVLGSAAIEHKVAAGPFARAFPAAELWVAPDQYSFPFDWDNVGRGPEGLGRLDLTQLYFGLRVRPLPRSSAEGSVPWAKDLDHLVLGPLKSRGGQAPGLFEDVAMLHKRSSTLLITDLIQTAPAEIPEIVLQDPRALLFHARDNAFDRVPDTPEVRQRGWERIALFSLFFQPGGLNIIPWGQAFQDLKGGQMNELGWGGLFPFEWRREEGPHPAGKTFWRQSFEALKDKAFVPAILQKLILDREPDRVLAFADAVAKWDFKQIVPAHLGAPIAGGPEDWRRAFAFLDQAADADFPGNLEALPLSGDAQFLQDISDSLVQLGSVAKPDARVERLRSKVYLVSCLCVCVCMCVRARARESVLSASLTASHSVRFVSELWAVAFGESLTATRAWQRREAAGIAQVTTASPADGQGWGPFRNR